MNSEANKDLTAIDSASCLTSKAEKFVMFLIIKYDITMTGNDRSSVSCRSGWGTSRPQAPVILDMFQVSLDYSRLITGTCDREFWSCQIECGLESNQEVWTFCQPFFWVECWWFGALAKVYLQRPVRPLQNLGMLSPKPLDCSPDD